MNPRAQAIGPYDPVMDLVRPRIGGDREAGAVAPPHTQPEPDRRDDDPRRPPGVSTGKPKDPKSPKEAGASRGINIAPGSEDDGWVVPPPVALSDGTRVQLYKDGEALHAAFEAIKAAKKRVCLESYIFAGDDTGKAFADLLSARARDGVKVFVLYDSFGSFESDRAMFHGMARSGVRLQEFHPIRPWDCRYSWRPFNRDHRKMLVVDDQIAGLGGLNVGAEYAGSWIVKPSQGPCDYWRDNAIGVRGPAARLLLNSFIMATGITVGKLAVSVIAAFAVTYLRGSEAEVGVVGVVPAHRGRGLARQRLAGRRTLRSLRGAASTRSKSWASEA